MPMAKRRRRPKRSGQAVLSGASWVAQFPTSVDVADLASPFRENVAAFLSALQSAGANVIISATYRPSERAFLMHYAFRIAREGLDPRQVPARSGIDIDWVHKKANGQADLIASKNAAEDMVVAYGIVHKPALNSNHIRRQAIDMTISWTGTLAITNKQGKVVQITSTPRSGQNHELHAVGKSYNVIKLVKDPPHWSVDGQFRARGSKTSQRRR
jgi:hypothetical protein